MTTGIERKPLLTGGLPTQYVDVDPEETAEWVESLDTLIDAQGNYRARYLMLSLLRRAAERNVGVPSLRSTDYINTISPEMEPWFPGDEAIEKEITMLEGQANPLDRAASESRSASTASARSVLPGAFCAAASLPHLHPDKRRLLLQSISEAAATAPGWSAREPSFYPEWVEKIDETKPAN